MKYAQGSRVEYNNGVIKGYGIVVGYALTEQMVIGSTAIIEDCSGNIPNTQYPFTHFVCAEVHLSADLRVPVA